MKNDEKWGGREAGKYSKIKNTIMLLIIRQYQWCTKSNHESKTKKLLLGHHVWSALPISGEGHRCANIHIGLQFGAPRLFSCQSPINWSLQNGKGNTLEKRWRQHQKANRQWSPRSETWHIQSMLSSSNHSFIHFHSFTVCFQVVFSQCCSRSDICVSVPGISKCINAYMWVSLTLC